MGKTYADNPLNRRLGRVGKPLGSMPQTSSRTDANVNVDNVRNRQQGGVGQPHGTNVVSEARGPRKKTDASSANTSTMTMGVNIDNSENRPLRCVDQPLGMAPVSEHREHSSDTNSRTSRSSSTVPKEVLKSDKSTRGTKVYVDNPKNRRLGRVGLPHGTAVVSKEDRNMSPVLYKRNVSSCPSSSSVTRSMNNALDANIASISQRTVLTSDVKTTNSVKVYVDNARNRQLGPGVSEHLVHSTDSNTRSANISSTTSRKVLASDDMSTKSTRVSANSTTNRKLVREDQGSRVSKARNASPSDEFSDEEEHPLTKNDSSRMSLTFNSLCKESITKSKKNTCADNSYNRKLDAAAEDKEPRKYVDNPQNRKLDRVGLPLGSKVFSSKTKDITTRLYADTPLNRKLGRVGKPQGSMPRRSIATDKIPEMIEKLINKGITEVANESRHDAACSESYDMSDTTDPSIVARQQAMCHYNRKLAEESWQKAKKVPPKTEFSCLEGYKGTKINYGDLKLQKKIGRGGFGDVYFAKWYETVVAVKVLRDEKMSEKDISCFADEVRHFSQLSHPNIVTFIGACTMRPNLCIVMEYMQLSLFDALHVRRIEFSDEETLSITQQISKGIKYLHEKRIAHCDIKSANILMDYVESKICEVKITDFGLSLIRQNSTLSSSQDEAGKHVRYRGTPRYSAPEIIRGEILSVKDMMYADIYSLGLVLFETIFSEEPYHDFSAVQLQQQVGRKGVTPEISEENLVDDDVLTAICQAWSFEPKRRPSAREISDTLNRTVCIFMEE